MGIAWGAGGPRSSAKSFDRPIGGWGHRTKSVFDGAIARARHRRTMRMRTASSRRKPDWQLGTVTRRRSWRAPLVNNVARKPFDEGKEKKIARPRRTRCNMSLPSASYPKERQGTCRGPFVRLPGMEAAEPCVILRPREWGVFCLGKRLKIVEMAGKKIVSRNGAACPLRNFFFYLAVETGWRQLLKFCCYLSPGQSR